MDEFPKLSFTLQGFQSEEDLSSDRRPVCIFSSSDPFCVHKALEYMKLHNLTVRIQFMDFQGVPEGGVLSEEDFLTHYVNQT